MCCTLGWVISIWLDSYCFSKSASAMNCRKVTMLSLVFRFLCLPRSRTDHGARSVIFRRLLGWIRTYLHYKHILGLF